MVKNVIINKYLVEDEIEDPYAIDPAIHLEVIVEGEEMLLEPLMTRGVEYSAPTVMYWLDTCIHDDRHDLKFSDLGKVHGEQKYKLSCDYCEYALYLRDAPSKFDKFIEKEP